MKKHSNPWYSEGIGHLVWAREQETLERALNRLFGYHYVQLGDPAFVECAQFSLIQHRIFVTPFNMNVWPCSLVRSKETALPLRNDSVDVVCLPHVLEQSEMPHQVLREVSRVLIPGGHVVLTGFNPFSIWCSWYMGVQYIRAHRRGYHFISTLRMRDWLQLLGFEILEVRSFFLRPFLSSSMIEQIGERWFPFLGAVYMIVAVKRVGALRCVRPQFKETPVWAEVPRPT